MNRFRLVRATRLALLVVAPFAGCSAGAPTTTADVPVTPLAPAAEPTPDAGDGGALEDPPSSADRGATLVAERGCPRCHQSTDPDDGILSGQTSPRPGTQAYGANLTPDVETGLGGWSDAMILRAIRAGVDDERKPLCVMPHFADLSPEEGAAIVTYLRELTPVHHEIPESTCGEGSDASADGPRDASDAGAAADAASCSTFVAPAVAALCHACGVRPCQPNGCFGGYYCETVSRTCHPAPAGCAGH